MALPVTDTFTNSDSTALETHNSAWAFQGSGSWAINTNAAYADGTDDAGVYYSGESWSNDQYAQADISAMTDSGSGRIGVACRLSESSTVTGYRFIGRGNFGGFDRFLEECTNDSVTLIESDGVVLTVGETIRIESNGTSIRALVDDSEVLSGTNSAITSGAGGMWSDNNALTTKRLDDFEAGDLSVINTIIEVRTGPLR